MGYETYNDSRVLKDLNTVMIHTILNKHAPERDTIIGIME